MNQNHVGLFVLCQAHMSHFLQLWQGHQSGATTSGYFVPAQTMDSLGDFTQTDSKPKFPHGTMKVLEQTVPLSGLPSASCFASYPFFSVAWGKAKDGASADIAGFQIGEIAFTIEQDKVM